MRILSLFVVGVLGTFGLTVTHAPLATAAKPDPAAPKTVVAPVQAVAKVKETPIPEGTSYYCAVGIFVPFNDIPGYEPESVSTTYIGNPFVEDIGPAPFDDAASINGIVFSPVGATHQTQLGDFSYGQGGSPLYQTCEEMRQKSDGFFADTATITYVPTQKCAGAIAKVKKASKAVEKAQKKLGTATSAADRKAAEKALKKAKAKLKKAKKKRKLVCS